jgi:DNA-3-methyladenine glycosylase I
MTVKRCSWAETDPLLLAYHDEEWGVPVHDSRALWEMLMLESFQAGLSWLTILRKREAFRKAFKGFKPEKVARFGEPDIIRLLGDAGIVRSRVKIQATIGGAQAYLEMAKAGNDFSTYLWNMAPNGEEEISKTLKKLGFKFVGPTIVYAWMQAVGMVNGHAADCFRHKAVG